MSLGTNIPLEPVRISKKEVVITLAKAVAQANNRGSINAAQKAGRSGRAPAPVSAAVVVAVVEAPKVGRKRKAPAATVVEQRASKRVRKTPAKYTK